ncbi:hypothetical protein GCM10007939_03960 [Amylibacter marinus]|uniref:Uncharacterized protein n=1 Tax=Amylibacter marinus TaxID=1475483 RepID=A0ABQ5VSB5_9RHOB|nr:hypothetical protein [Amylibacter marinus]GLQ34113.1 hypothetical protein GCM10007939_03960 [Amylibacter marinus]
MQKPENLFFRTKENGAAVFRMDTENRHRRLDFKQIATLNLQKGEIKPQGDEPPTDAEREEIEKWIVQRRKTIADRQIDDIYRAIDHLNLTTQWMQSKATDSQIEILADDLLLAMHDLRSVIVRKKSDLLQKK